MEEEEGEWVRKREGSRKKIQGKGREGERGNEADGRREEEETERM